MTTFDAHIDMPLDERLRRIGALWRRRHGEEDPVRNLFTRVCAKSAKPGIVQSHRSPRPAPGNL